MMICFTGNAIPRKIMIVPKVMMLCLTGNADPRDNDDMHVR